jgi:sodium/bile acid cotransporter 7
MNHYLKAVLFLWITGAGLVPQLVFGAEELLDKHKKEIVYEIYAEYKKSFPAVKDITPQMAMELLTTGKVVFVDTRKAAEMKVSMLPNAVPKEEFLLNLPKFANQTIIGYCTISYRSGVFAREMAQKGITIYNLTGGLLAWVLEGGKVYDLNGETKRIHVYGQKWNYAPQGYTAVMFGFLGRYF